MHLFSRCRFGDAVGMKENQGENAWELLNLEFSLKQKNK